MAVAQNERRRYWLSLAALIIAMPAAVLVGSWENLEQWRANHRRIPIPVEPQVTQHYAGAEWRLSSLTRLPGGSPDRTVMLAEFEAMVDDAAILAASPCEVALTDTEGRRWKPGFLTEPIVRELHPDAAGKPRCGSFAFEGAGHGSTIGMAETFIVPVAAKEFALSITVTDGLPQYLLLR